MLMHWRLRISLFWWYNFHRFSVGSDIFLMNVGSDIDSWVIDYLLFVTGKGGWWNFLTQNCSWFSNTSIHHYIKSFSFQQLINTIILCCYHFFVGQLFERPIGVNVPQSRFLPINSTSDLLLLQVILTIHNLVVLQPK